MDSAQQNELSTDYAALVARLRQGEVVECHINTGIWKVHAAASYNKRFWGEIFELTMKADLDVVMISSECEFVDFCDKNMVAFNTPMGVMEVAA
ncbi:MAG: hypothetical protein ACXV8Q_19700 [Methylobacter sp.]